MFISREIIQESIKELEFIHPFYGTTFLVCKKHELPTGEPEPFPIETFETEFLEEFYDPAPQTDYFFRLFRVSDKLKLWVNKTKYASSTLQSIRTRSAFSEAFLHPRGSGTWAWQPDYVGVLRANLSFNLRHYKGNRIPTFLLAAWLFRERSWSANTRPQDIVSTFREEFNINIAEYGLFELEVTNDLFERPLLQEKPVTWDDLKGDLGNPPDAEPEVGETLSSLELSGIGPTEHLLFETAERLNLLTGDNGLGKSFLLECVWWALTGGWTSVQAQAFPKQDGELEPSISFEIAGKQSRLEKVTSVYDSRKQSWRSSEDHPNIRGLAIYARVDGSFAIWNPVRQVLLQDFKFEGREVGDALIISNDEVWNGVKGQIEGLLRDWIEWQNDSSIQQPFEVFKRVLERLSPPDLGILEPGEPVRLPYESKRIPTLRHPYGEVPIIHASAAVRRILALAYVIVWTWNEHQIYSEMSKNSLQRRMVILIDEIDAHLHPLWQRRVLPALLDVKDELSDDLQIQFFVATHSPLVLASAESLFNYETDGLFHLNLTRGHTVEFNEIEFVRQGSVDAWLTSEVFDLRHARSFPAEQAIERAKDLQKSKNPSREAISEASIELSKTLAADDDFWSRWNYFVEIYGAGNDSSPEKERTK